MSQIKIKAGLLNTLKNNENKSEFKHSCYLKGYYEEGCIIGKHVSNEDEEKCSELELKK